MADNSKIEWTDATWNPVRGCSLVSAGCTNCYAMKVAGRFSGAGQPYEGLTMATSQGAKWTGEIRLVHELLDQPRRWRRPRRIFVNSMSDLFHEAVPDKFIAEVFCVMAQATQHTFQILTKRPARMLDWLSKVKALPIAGQRPGIMVFPVDANLNVYVGQEDEWPLKHVWLGFSAESQHTFDERWLHVEPLAGHGWKTWCSAEPLLGHIDLSRALWPFKPCANCPCPDPQADASQIEQCCREPEMLQPALHWVVAGGESGSQAQPVHPDWLRDIRDQCEAAVVPFFFKQWGEWQPAGPTMQLPLDRWKEFPTGAAEARDVVCFGDAVHTPVQLVGRVGRKAAGRLLDGVEHNDYPEVPPC
jgi:protein gp37